MKFTGKRSLAFLLAALMLLTATACTGTNPPEETTVPTDTAAPEESTAPESDTAAPDTKPEDTEEGTEGEPLLPPADFEVSEENGTASVSTPAGLSYTVTGYTAMNQGVFAFDRSLSVAFPEGAFDEKFNRFTVTYASTQPLKVWFTFTERGKTLEEYYFLDAGSGDFSGLNPGFVTGFSARKLSALRVESCNGKAAEFTLSALATEAVETPDSSLYLENDRFKLGIDLSWGGTVNYLQDKTCTVEGLTNLVNRHDTGRLIQQSFYGTPGVPGVYEPGISFDSKWVYNPVQGGDQYNNPSRLIDLVITETSIYIKSQPQDWSLNNKLTPSYMENTYTLAADHVRVDNRFTDYSGWEHPFAGQELPALYTVSYLDKFVWYDGEASWTGDALSSRNDLKFWGEFEADCTFPYRGENSETWCAWVSSAEDYGLGLFVPAVDRLKAGRYLYDGSKSDTAQSTGYVAPYNTIKLVSFKPLSYSYMLTAGTTASIRDTFTKHKDFTDNAGLRENYQPTRLPSIEGDVTKLDFSEGKNLALIANPINTAVSYDADRKAVSLLSGSLGDSSITISYGDAGAKVNAADVSILRIEYMIPEENGRIFYECDIFPCAGSIAMPDGNARIRESLITDGEYHVLEVDLSAYAFWSGDVHSIRFDYFDFSEDGDVMYIKSVTLE